MCSSEQWCLGSSDFAYFVLLNLCTVSSERDSELFSPHPLFISSPFILSVPSSPILQQLGLSFIVYTLISVNLLLECLYLLPRATSDTTVQTFFLEFSTSTDVCQRRLPFLWWWVNWGHKQKDVERPRIESVIATAYFCRCVTTAKYFEHCPENSVISETEIKSWECNWAQLKIYLSSKSNADLENF